MPKKEDIAIIMDHKISAGGELEIRVFFDCFAKVIQPPIFQELGERITQAEDQTRDGETLDEGHRKFEEKQALHGGKVWGGKPRLVGVLVVKSEICMAHAPFER